MNLSTVLILFVLLSQMGIAHGEVYRWVDDNGNVVFGDSPPPSLKKAKKLKPIVIETPTPTGTQFATPEQIQQMQDDAKTRQRTKSSAPNNIDTQCRTYISQLNKVEIYLEHTSTARDEQKAKDLRKLIKMECGPQALYANHRYRADKNDWRCKQYRENIAKIEIYLEHTPTDRDKQTAIDLRKQAARECR